MRRALGLVVAAVLLAGCGYSTRGSLPDHIRTVAVPMFKNRTLEPGVDDVLAQRMGLAAAWTNQGGGARAFVQRGRESYAETSDPARLPALMARIERTE